MPALNDLRHYDNDSKSGQENPSSAPAWSCFSLELNTIGTECRNGDLDLDVSLEQHVVKIRHSDKQRRTRNSSLDRGMVSSQ